MEKEIKSHPQEKANLISRATLWWIFPLLRKGYNSPLKHEDLYSVREEDRAEYLTERLHEVWEHEKRKAKDTKRKALLWKALLRFFTWTNYGFIVFTTATYIIASNVTWFSLVKLVMEIGSVVYGNALLNQCFIYVWGVAAGELIMALSANHFYVYGAILGIRARAATTGLLFKKVLQVSKRSIHAGNVMKLVCDDCQLLATSGEWFIQDLFRSIIIALSAIGWLFYFVGWQTVIVSIFFILLAYIRIFAAKYDHKFCADASFLADKRLGYLREIFTGIRSIKLNTWEERLEKKIKKTRRKEAILKAKRWALMSFWYSFSSFGQQVWTFISILLIVFTDSRKITYEIVFAIMTYSAQIIFLFSVTIPFVLRLITNVQISLKRIQEFLELNNQNREINGDDLEDTLDKASLIIYQPPVQSSETTDETLASNKRYLCIQSVTCKLPIPCSSYEQSSYTEKSLLCNVTLSVEDRGLIMITGTVGSGKSSLLECVLGGELLVLTGAIRFSGKLAYVSQTPWVFPGTVRENILFGLPYNEYRYFEVIKACQLEMDLNVFPRGDLSRIGEHGSTVSGGQRTRIALARAVYSQADIFLLDDPLSSLDANVAENVFNHCLRGILADRIVLLTTHQLRNFKDADHIVKLDRGKIVAQGDPESMKKYFNQIEFDMGQHDVISVQESRKTTDKNFDEEMAEDEQMTEILREAEEGRVIGYVSLKVYWEYFKSGVPVFVLLLVAVIFCAGKGLLVLVDLDVSWLSSLPTRGQRSRRVLMSYSILLVVALFLIMFGNLSISLIMMNANRVVHNKMVTHILRAPLIFHAANPIGRIMNRFSQDISNLDDLLPHFFTLFFQYFPLVIAAIVLACAANVILIPFSVATVLVFLFISRFFYRSSMDLKRLMSIAGGPLYSHFSNTIEGLRIIRVHEKQRKFIKDAYSRIDEHDQAMFAYYIAARWFANTLDLICVVYLTIVSIVLVLMYSTNAVVAVTSILYVSSTIHRAQFVIRMFAEIQSQMTSAERTLAYTKIDSEKGWDTSRKPPKDWPTMGDIHFSDVSLRHYENGPRALRNISFHIRPSEKIGIAGRTGAGKSSLVAAIMRISESEGEIIIDDINIKDLHVQYARRQISVISQSPILLNSSMRLNLDPQRQFTDSEIWEALGHMQMKSVISSLPGQLEYEITGSGSNFSVGERQLLHLARVLLRKNKIIIFDEATANVDPNTDEVIQRKIREEFKTCTVITIAHRLNTILDCDRIMLLDRGEIVEFDNAKILLKKGGFFSQLYEASNTN